MFEHYPAEREMQVFNPAFAEAVRQKRQEAERERYLALKNASQRRSREVKAAIRAAKDEKYRARSRHAVEYRLIPDRVRDMIVTICGAHGVEVSHVLGNNRCREVVFCRDEIQYELKRTNPNLSFPKIGQWFNRDHTSVMHSVAAHAERTGLPPLSTYNLNRVKKRNYQAARQQRIRAAEARDA